MSKDRVLRTKMFLGSMIENVDKELDSFLRKNNICVGNYVDIKLHKLGGVYQLILVYAEVVDVTEPKEEFKGTETVANESGPDEELPF